MHLKHDFTAYQFKTKKVDYNSIKIFLITLCLISICFIKLVLLVCWDAYKTIKMMADQCITRQPHGHHTVGGSLR